MSLGSQNSDCKKSSKSQKSFYPDNQKVALITKSPLNIEMLPRSLKSAPNKIKVSLRSKGVELGPDLDVESTHDGQKVT